MGKIIGQVYTLIFIGVNFTVITQQIKKSFKNKRVLVTGGTGLIGRQIVNLLLNFGSFVKTVSLDQLNLWNDVDHHIGDLTDFNYVKEITKDVDFVFHVAGIKGSVVVTEQKPANFLRKASFFPNPQIP